MTTARAPLIRAEGLYYSYVGGTPEPVPALRGIDLRIHPGEYVAVVGANGSGKSTLLRHFNALLQPDAGNVWVHEWNTREAVHLRSIRSSVGMVFQVPDAQIVASTVEEDVAFGPENLGIEPEALQVRVREALDAVGLTGYEERASHALSAGQKQRLAIAAALAMHPRCILFDEATSVLDPQGRLQLLNTMQALCSQGLAVVTVTHDMTEAARAHRVVVLHNGEIAMQGDPRSVFAQENHLLALGLETPAPTHIAHRLAGRLPFSSQIPVTVEELADEVAGQLKLHGQIPQSNPMQPGGAYP